MVLLFCSLLSHDLQLSLGWFAAECEVSGISQLAPPGLRPWYSVRKQWSAHSRQGTRCCLKWRHLSVLLMSEGEWGESLTDRLVQHLQSLGLIRSGEESFDLWVDPCSYPHLQAVFQRKNKKLSYSREAWSRVECLLDTSKAPGHAEELPSLVWLVCLFQLFYLLVKMTLNDHTYVHNCIFTKNNSSCQSFFL